VGVARIELATPAMSKQRLEKVSLWKTIEISLDFDILPTMCPATGLCGAGFMGRRILLLRRLVNPAEPMPIHLSFLTASFMWLVSTAT
jgi:hypothetical protein